MHTFETLSKLFIARFDTKHFTGKPVTLYEPADYFLSLGGKRIRPVMCLMANELFDDIIEDTWNVATAIELFHNFTLIHDDIMDKAPLRRGLTTVHIKYGEPTALLAGDVMLVTAYDYLNRMKSGHLQKVIHLFNKTAKEVCEGQQLDMDFEQNMQVSMDEYLHMIELKTSVLLAASLKLGAILGGAGDGNQQHMYEFGRNLGISFQIQDDYLDAFGDPAKVGKQAGGDIKVNKKTFLMIKALESCNDDQLEQLTKLMKENPDDKVERVLEIFRSLGVDKWAISLKEQYMEKAFQHLEEIAVLNVRKEPLRQLTYALMQREY
ncbi:polyprenyl synthetase family protein [Pinibacter aurantiacus]|uniref:Polyprenyl synthetase family protein n=1 Tax=Pinibacter aurantiacus TaxID=2851599 RepID=A0A9E2SBK2_9BACT|nr:polyprenyl synthetase family protein [Pinibacter aurantiacus]MBV4358449.1 polyprenyl synthetase family protein [Pinibacter aurantiacus]